MPLRFMSEVGAPEMLRPIGRVTCPRDAVVLYAYQRRRGTWPATPGADDGGEQVLDQIELRRGIDRRAIELNPNHLDVGFDQARKVLDEWQNEGARTTAPGLLEERDLSAGRKGGERARPRRVAKKVPKKKRAR